MIQPMQMMQPLQLMQPVQMVQQGQETSKKPTQTKPRAKKVKFEEEMVEVCAITYECPSNKPPNYFLHGHIDKYPIEDICGFGQDVRKSDVSFV